MRRAGIALGSNLGDRAAHLRLATAFLASLHCGPATDFLVSPVYETEPDGCAPGTPAFLNAVAEISTELPPALLLEALRGHESASGRPADREKNSSRPIDLDILYIDDRVINTTPLAVPHPRAAGRAFVMVPLADIAPDRKLPGIPGTVASIAAAMPRTGLRRTDISLAPPPGSFPERAEWIARKAAGHRPATLTAYDFPMARILDGLGLDFLLVGDSLGMVQLGRPDTTSVTMAEMLHHTRAVAAGARFTPVVADLPAGSCGSSADALANARALREAGAGAVKIEGGSEIVPHISALVHDGIPVVGHLGMLPQRVREEGGYRIKGKSGEEAARLVSDALAVQEVGASAVVLELVHAATAEMVTRALEIPTIGIGSGESCDGRILVTNDLLGLSPWFRPGFARPAANLAAGILRAAAGFRDGIRPPAD